MNATSLNSFASELEKIADMVLGPEDAPVVAGGIFVGSPKDHKRKAELVLKLLKKHKSLQKTRTAYEKLHPEDFVTLAFKREHSPGVLSKVKGFFGSDKAKSAIKSYEDRVARPRTFVRAGPSAGYQQGAFYSEVARGLYDNELNQPHVHKKDRVVYL